MMNESVEKFEIEEELVNFNGPEDDSDFDDEDDFGLEMDASMGGFDDFDDEDEDDF
ncbi:MULTISPECIES: hypothetical protein [Sphingobacterium]|uniref:hypothetical protein n=1 Tax=Sphingobacterium TaxID=28453 RepID=UPI0013DA6999|nr:MULTISPECIES: hypothetical protein [unclassified Sphingobacterium]